MKEPKIIKTTLRDSIDSEGINVIDIECRFEDGQKYSAITVDTNFPQLADRINKFLNSKENIDLGECSTNYEIPESVKERFRQPNLSD